MFDVQLLTLHRSEVDLPAADELLLHRLGVCARLLQPGGDRAFIQAKGGHDRRHRTAIDQEGQHDEHDPLRGLQTKERACGGCRKGRLAGVADVPAFLMRMDPHAPACWTLQVRAYSFRRAQGGHVGDGGHTAEIPHRARFVNAPSPRCSSVSQTGSNDSAAELRAVLWSYPLKRGYRETGFPHAPPAGGPGSHAGVGGNRVSPRPARGRVWEGAALPGTTVYSFPFVCGAAA